MNREWVLTKESFDALLAWLDPDRELAAQQYEAIRKRLIKIFACRGCATSEDLADETINRVISKLSDIGNTFIGERSRYFYGVANKVYLEYLRRKPLPPAPPPMDDTDKKEREYACLEHCMQELTADNRTLVLEYYQEEKQAKIDHRKQLAAHLGIALNALRIRAHRIRTSLQQCVQNCVQAASA
jgi:DNA-directed RNA polymerase specialized sigma24 family protein